MTLPFIATMTLLAVAASACGRTEPAVERLPYPVAAKGDVVDDYAGDEGPRSVPMDGGARFEGSGGLGRGLQCGHGPVPREAAAARAFQHAPDRALELSARRRAGDRRRQAVLREEHRAAAPVAACSSAAAQRRRPRWSSIPTSSPRTVRSRCRSGARRPTRSCSPTASSEGGADWNTIRVRDIASGKDLPDEVQWMRFSGISWTHDSRGFFYSRYPEPPKNKVLEAALSGQALYYHRIGTPQSQDRLVYERKDLPSLDHQRRGDRRRPLPADRDVRRRGKQEQPVLRGSR